MMYRKISLFTLIITILFLNESNFIYCYNKENKKTLILYETENQTLDNNSISYLNELLYVFDKDIDKLKISNYKGNLIKRYDYIFIINIHNDIDNKKLLNDLEHFNGNIYWIGDKLENFLDYTNKYDITYEGQSSNISKLIYKNRKIKLNNSSVYNIVNPSRASNIIARMSDDYNEYPFIIKEKNLYYISNWDTNQSYIFEDSINDFYNRVDFTSNKIFVEISNIGANSDYKKLRQIADYLYKKQIPFAISLIPTEEEDIISVIKYMQKKGGSVILNGDYFNEISKRKYDMNNDIKEYILNNLNICIKNEIYPIAFTTRYNTIDQNEYKKIQEIFSTYIGGLENNYEEISLNNSPYLIEYSNDFNIFIPKNLGYITNEDNMYIEKIKERFYNLSMVRGYTGGLSIDESVSINDIKDIIDYLSLQDVKFIDLKKGNNIVEIDDIKISSYKDKIIIKDNGLKQTHQKPIKYGFEMIIKNINNIIVIFIKIVLMLFLIIFIVFRIINKNKYKRSKK